MNGMIAGNGFDLNVALKEYSWDVTEIRRGYEIDIPRKVMGYSCDIG